MATNAQEEFCPECGEFVDQLVENTGWCVACSAVLNGNTRTSVEQFLESNADHLEHYLMQGKSLNQAIDSMRSEIAAFRTCACCGGFIKRGGRNSIFCRKNLKCRQIARRYVYLYDRKGLSKSEALAVVIAILNGSE